MKQSKIVKIRENLLDLLEYTSTEEPELHSRLQELWNWIKDKKDGLIMNKNHVLNLLTEVINDSVFWLNYQTLTKSEKTEIKNQLTTSRKYWSLVLFPTWFREKDPKLKKWKQALLKNKFKHLDLQDIIIICQEIEQLGGSTHICYLLDLSMATDLIAANNISATLAVQLTTLSEKWLDTKQDEWEKTLKYWQIKRGLLLSYSPQINDFDKASLIFQKCTLLPDICYDVFLL